MNLPRLLFLDDDHVVRNLRMLLSAGPQDPSVISFFAPERVDFAGLMEAATGLREVDGAVIGQGDAFEDADVIVYKRGRIDGALLTRHPRLKLIQRLGERTDGIDLVAAAARGVRVSCMRRITMQFTAEHVILLMLALGKQLLVADRAVREGRPGAPSPLKDSSHNNWTALSSATGLHGKTLGIVGLGEVGTHVAKLARAFGMTVVYSNRTRASPHIERAAGAQFASMEELLGSADHVSLNVPNLPENGGLVNELFLSQMRRTAYFVNTSRGRLVDEDALYKALTDGTIAGAGLDVHASEPRLPGDRISKLSNVILTPHIGGGLKSGLLQEYSVIVKNCLSAMRGGVVEYEARSATGSSCQ